MPLKAWLDGELPDLQRLAQLYATGGPKVLRDDECGRYYLTAAELDRAHQDDRVYDVIQILLNSMNGAAKLETPDFKSVAYGRRYVTASGDQLIQPRTAVVAIRGGSPDVVVSGPDGKPIPQPPPPAVARVALAASNPTVRNVLRALAGEQDWYDLWKVYETIRDSVGNGSKKRGTDALVKKRQWITKAEEGAFRESANNPDISGEAARHAIPTSPTPPAQTMTLAEGQAFISGLVHKWLASLGV
ncbi:hypothetical protein [Mycobacteroides abscessus]